MTVTPDAAKDPLVQSAELFERPKCRAVSRTGSPIKEEMKERELPVRIQ